MSGMRRVLNEYWLTLLVVGAIAGAYFALRSSATDLSSVEEYEALIQNGQGSVVYFFSDRCPACLVAKPSVDAIAGQATVPVVQVNVASAIGRSLTGDYAVRGTPTLLVLDGEGREVLRQVGHIDRQAVLQALMTAPT